MTPKIVIWFVLLALVLFLPAGTYAQTPTPAVGPIYIVQEGETLWEIALRFRVDLEELQRLNHITNPNLISPGQELRIPGLEDLQGYLVTIPVPLGETLRSLSRAAGTSEEVIRRLNRLVSPTEVYAGSRLIVLKPDKENGRTARSMLAKGDTLLEFAIRQNTDPWTLLAINHLPTSWATLPDDVLYLPSGDSVSGPSGLPKIFRALDLWPLPLKQGATAQIKVRVGAPLSSLEGMLADYPLRFFPLGGDTWLALQGVHALLPSGVYPLALRASLPDGSQQAFEQMVLVEEGHYIHENLVVNRSYIDPAVTEPENAQILSVVREVTPTRYWNGGFTSPAYFPDCYTSRFGNRRTYISEDSSLTLEGFHTGLDFCGGSGLPIIAPAAGTVVFAGPLEVRGNATIIDHGWGVYSGFWHQSKILVQVGQKVEAGEVIGEVGGTGRVTGAHLHWEIWVNGVQVDPLTWLEAEFPH